VLRIYNLSPCFCWWWFSTRNASVCVSWGWRLNGSHIYTTHIWIYVLFVYIEMWFVYTYSTVDGRNPAPRGMYKTLGIMGYLPYQLVHDFFHQLYVYILSVGAPDVKSRSGFCFTKNCYQGLLTFSQTTIQVETIFILGNDYSKSCFRECQRVPGCLQLQPENMTICRDRLPSALLNVRMVNSNKEPESLRCWRGKNLEDGPNGAKKERDCLSMMKK